MNGCITQHENVVFRGDIRIMRDSLSQMRYSDSTFAHKLTLIDILRWRSCNQPDQHAYTFLLDGETEKVSMTYTQLDQRARSIAATLQEHAIAGDRALLLYPSGLDYISAFLGCLYAGIIAVPAYPPSSERLLSRIQTIAADAQPTLVLTNTPTHSKVERWFAQLPASETMHLIATDRYQEGCEHLWQPQKITYDALAFLQYSSGSTDAPKGMMISHRNLMHNLAMQCECWQLSSVSVGISWLPMFHDMGLIAGVLQPLYAGFPAILMASTAFVQRPLRWLQAISHYQGTLSWAPNFAYDLCLERINPEEQARLDLSTWSVAGNGAEPIRMETLLRFVETFQTCGFRKEAFTPGYGLAEGTLMVSSSHAGTPPVFLHVDKAQLEQHHVVVSSVTSKETHPFVGCGLAARDQRIVIVRPETGMRCDQDEVGEIWVAGPSVAVGYWQHPLQTEQTFQASLQDTGERPFLRTGDLGFLYGEEVFITGRLKDSIIIHGHNHYPQDLERTVEQSHSSLRSGCGAAFSLEITNTERLVIVQEVVRNYQHTDATFAAIRQEVLESNGIQVYAIALVRYGGILKTSSGKIQRRACREALLAGKLPVLFADIPQPLADLIEQHGSQAEKVPATTAQPEPAQIDIAAVRKDPLASSKPSSMQFSLLYFSSNEAEFSEQKYTLLLEGAKFADQHDFTAIWVPERHFHVFGGLYPNPAVLAAALAMITQKIRLRAGSVVLPMHHPARVVEEWSTVDNLSSGRVDLAFATGWNPNDFVLAPENYKQRKDVLFAGIETVQKLWRGEAMIWPNGLGQQTAIRIYPLPKQQQLTPWITCSGNPERFVEAGSIGANILTGLLFQSVEELAKKINLYREALAHHGYDPEQGHVTLMIHTFVGEDIEEVREKVRLPFMAYLESSVDLWRHGMEKLDKLSPQDRENVLSYAFERYFNTHALFGTPQTCQSMIEQLAEIGVNEIASLIDFGVDIPSVMESLYWLNALRKRSQRDEITRKDPSKKKKIVEKKFAITHEREYPTAVETANSEKASIHSQHGQFFLQHVLEATQEQAQVLLQNYLQQRIASVMERSVEEIANASTIRTLGLDSLMVSSIINHCQHDLAVTLDAGQFYRQESLTEIAQYIAREIDARQSQKESRNAVQETGLVLRRQEHQGRVFPLSFAQQRLWFLHQLQPDSAAYNVPTAIHVEGQLNIRALAWSLEGIIKRHESLRTLFTINDGQPVQVISPPPPFPLSVVNLQSLDSQTQETQVQHLARQQAQLPFDLIHGPAVRMVLLWLSGQEYVLLFTYHHIVADGWSRGIFMRELQALYTACSSAQTTYPLAELPIQYADYAVWQQQWLHNPVNSAGDQPGQQGYDSHEEDKERGQTPLEKQLAYWQKQLGGMLPTVNLPTRQPRPPIQTFHGAHQSIHLPEQLMQELKELSKQEGVSLFMTLLASFQVLLARYTGLEDILVGTPIAGRNRVEVEPLIGFFVNTLALRTDLAGNPSFKEVLLKVRDVCLGAYAHQDVPFEKIVEALRPERDLSRHPLFQVMFVLENDAWRFEIDLDEVKLRQLEIESGLSTFDLTCIISSSGLGEVEYNTDLFEVSIINALLEHWQMLLQGIVAHTELPIAELPLLTPEECQLLLVDWNADRTDYQPGLCLHEIFEIQVERTPDAVAVVYKEEYLTYKALNRRANQLACSLRQLGVEPDMLVGLCLERSLDMIIGLLGILKAGGAYLPLDPAYPQSRLEDMLQTVALVLTQQQLQTKLPSCQKIACLDTSWPALLQQNDENVKHTSGPEHLAYVIYTSGSTGHPKGVQVTHQGINNLVTAQRETFSVQPGDHILQFASLSFDASVFEIVMALLTGATLVLERQEALLPGPGLIELLRERAITVVTLPPSVLIHLPVTPLPALETIIVAGEACPLDLVARWAPGRRFFNAYGPTEATVWSSVAKCRTEDQQKPCIGGPITNTELYVLDRYFQPVPIGVPGELYIGSPGLARGYLLQPELTAERFIPHPWGHRIGDRLYRTGDLVRYQQDGKLEFVGRVDQQVKLRGYRIELGETECVLQQHPAVREVVVLARTSPSDHGNSSSDTQLMAYVVPVEAPPSDNDLRSYLREKLPAYMVPAFFISLAQLPLNASGKVDRNALAQQRLEQQPTITSELPQTEVEHLLVHIWQEILKVPSIGLNNNFFDIGGHSLRLVQMQSELQKTFRRDIPIVDLFTHTTIRSLASYISQTQGEELLTFPDGERIHRHYSSTQRQRAARQQYRRESL